MAYSEVSGFEDFVGSGVDAIAGPRGEVAGRDSNADPEYGPPQSAAPATQAPALQDFQDAFTDPTAQEWSQEVSTHLNNYFQQRDIADASARAGQAFVNNLDQFKTGLTSMVQSDPHALSTALDIVPPTVAALVSTLPGGIENPDDHHAAVTQHIQHEIAAAAVTTAAETHEGLARGMLADERVSGILGESAGPLDTYIGMQAQARERDAAAQRGQQAVQVQKVADTTARGYIGDLVGPDSQPRSPPGWNQAVLSDPKVPPQDKIDLMGIHDRLGQNGDPPTDPVAAADMIHRMATGQASQRDLYPAIGSHVSMADGGFMAAALHSPTYLNQLDQTIQAGQRQYAPNGDIAETQAFGRFVDWLLPRARAGANLDPNNKEWVGANGMPDFRVQGDDLHAATMQDVAYRQPLAERRQLAEIFSNPEYHKPTRATQQQRYQTISFPAGSEVDLNADGTLKSARRPPDVARAQQDAQQAHDQAALVHDTDKRLLRQIPDPLHPGQMIYGIDPRYAHDRDGLARGAEVHYAPRKEEGGNAPQIPDGPPQPGDQILSGGKPMEDPRAAASRNANARYRPRRR